MRITDSNSDAEESPTCNYSDAPGHTPLTRCALRICRFAMTLIDPLLCNT